MGIGEFFAGRLIDCYGAKKDYFCRRNIDGVGSGFGQYYDTTVAIICRLDNGGIGGSGRRDSAGSLVVSIWFKAKRGLAIGIMSAGVGIGGLLMSPLVGSYLIPVFGWSAALLILAILALVIIIPLGWFVIRTKPSDMGLIPDGTDSPAKTKISPIASLSSSGMTPNEALVSSTLWLIVWAFFISGFAFMAVLQNVVPHLQDLKYPIATVTAAMSVISLGSALGKFSFGWLSDRILAKYAAFIGMVLQLGGILIFIFIGSTSQVSLIWVGAILLGLGIGSWLPTMLMITGRQFGLLFYGSIFGIVIMFQTFGNALGPFFAGRMYDSAGNYHWAFIICAITFVISMPAVLLLKKPK